MPRLVQWQQVWARLGVAAPELTVLERLIACYSEPHRKYHTVRHLDECFVKLEELRTEAHHPEEVELALWFHDAIYDTKRQDNEARSAEWARATASAANLPAAVADRIHSLVMATCHDAVPTELDEKVLVDVDLSILGEAPERFDEYERQIREEYSWVPTALFRAKRQEILRGFLARPSIFNTRRFVAAYEARARANLARSIKRLQA
jgi:predicted metal-dependent HD superfamily phosphohydrolase